jgi:hypothetical protein
MPNDQTETQFHLLSQIIGNDPSKQKMEEVIDFIKETFLPIDAIDQKIILEASKLPGKELLNPAVMETIDNIRKLLEKKNA